MKTIINNRPFVALAMTGIICATIVRVAEIINEESMIEKINVIVFKKDKNDVVDDEKVESVKE